jgi:hypothetical protein
VYEEETQDVIEETTEQAQQVWDVRQSFQDAITKGAWTLTPEESEELLSKASLPVILQAIQNMQVFLRQKNQVAAQYLPEELIQQLEEELQQELKRTKQPSQAVLIQPEHDQSIKGSRGRYGARSELKAEIERRISRGLSDEEFRDLCNTPGSRPSLLLQAARNASKHVSGVSKEFALEKLRTFLQKEIGKTPQCQR